MLLLAFGVGLVAGACGALGVLLARDRAKLPVLCINLNGEPVSIHETWWTGDTTEPRKLCEFGSFDNRVSVWLLPAD